jgi:hypothetical protein
MEQWNIGTMGWGIGRLPQHSIIPPFHRNPSRRLSACARFFQSLPGTQGLPEILPAE